MGEGILEILYAYYQLSVLETNHMSGYQVTILLSSLETDRQTDRPAACSPDSESVNQLYRNLDLSLSPTQMSHSPDWLTRRHQSHSSELVQILARTLSSVRQSEIQSTNIASPNCKHWRLMSLYNIIYTWTNNPSQYTMIVVK